MDDTEYEPPTLTEVGSFGPITLGQNGKAHADDSDAAATVPDVPLVDTALGDTVG